MKLDAHFSISIFPNIFFFDIDNWLITWKNADLPAFDGYFVNIAHLKLQVTLGSLLPGGTQNNYLRSRTEEMMKAYKTNNQMNRLRYCSKDYEGARTVSTQKILIFFLTSRLLAMLEPKYR